MVEAAGTPLDSASIGGTGSAMLPHALAHSSQKDFLPPELD